MKQTSVQFETGELAFYANSNVIVSRTHGIARIPSQFKPHIYHRLCFAFAAYPIKHQSNSNFVCFTCAELEIEIAA